MNKRFILERDGGPTFNGKYMSMQPWVWYVIDRQADERYDVDSSTDGKRLIARLEKAAR